MQVTEYSRRRDDNDGERYFYFDNRWMYRRINGPHLIIEWIDLFGYEENVVFEVHKANDRFQKFYPLTKEYGIIQLFHHFTSYFQCVKLNWNTQTYQLGKATSDEVLNNLTLVLPDRCYNLASTFIGFLITNYDSFQYCQFAVHQLEVLRTGHIYEIDANTNCLDFSKNIVSAVNHSATEIKQFNVVLGEVVRTIDITGLPQELRFSNGKSQLHISNTGTWTDDTLYIWTQKGANNLISESNIYSIDLNTGVASAIEQTFRPGINKLYFDTYSERIYYYNRSIQYIRRNEQDQTTIHMENPQRYFYRHFRVCLNRPESLFYMALKALPHEKSFPYVVNRMLERYNCSLPLNKV